MHDLATESIVYGVFGDLIWVLLVLYIIPSCTELSVLDAVA
jgi:hypothetical protein